MKKLCIPILTMTFLFASTTAYGNDLNFSADLSGAQEVVFDAGGNFIPGGTDTDAESTIKAKFDKGLTEVEVELKIEGLAGTFTRAHFHCGRPGQNGPIAFGLVDPGPLNFDDKGIKGTLTNDDFTGVDCMPAVGKARR